MSDTQAPARVTLDDAFTAVRHALTQAREAGYRVGRSMSPTSTDEDLDLASRSSRQADAMATTAWRLLYSALASHTWRAEDLPIPVHTTPDDEDLAVHSWLMEEDGNAWCLDCDKAALFCPNGAK